MITLDDAWAYISGFYLGMPSWAVPLFWTAAVVVLSSTLSLAILIVQAQRTIRHVERRPEHGTGDRFQSNYLWVFVVPALNEEITIADAVERLREVQVDHRHIIVVNDGSDDRTGGILEGLSGPDLTVLTRVAPQARQGKSEALNAAWRHLRSETLMREDLRGWDARRVIVTIVDADGRIDPRAGRVAGHFENRLVGGVQSLVCIYNRRSPLTWAQNLEFAVFGFVYQMGRMSWGTANMGGNGQFNRLQALNEVAVQGSTGLAGPWREGRLTEDQDIGLRIIEAGWRGRQSTLVTIEQQGLNSLRALYRQRTRWAQGSWQMLDLAGRLMRNPSVSFIGRWDQFWYLMTPLLQAFMGATVLITVILLASGIVSVAWSLPIFLLVYGFSVVPGVAGAVFARRSANPLRIIAHIVAAHGYVLYSWLIFPVVYRALWRQLCGRTSWAKTKREALEPPAAV
ncbi:MAG: glycosyltransferase family 2 protein [Microbacteriaceae bacterium]